MDAGGKGAIAYCGALGARGEIWRFFLRRFDVSIRL
jgi:hypothetical protein